MSQFHVGTSGYSYRHWTNGVFYPPEVKAAKFLEYYMTQFDCTELNVSFYRLPSELMVKSWLKRTPEHFRFCPKLSRWITHQKKLNDAEEPLKTFFERFEVLKGRLGPVLVQLPPNLGFNPAKAENFFKLLDVNYGDYRFALEVRHKAWLAEEALELLRRFRIAIVISQSGDGFPYTEATTSDFIYLRFHGPSYRYASDYSEEMLASYADKCRHWMKEGRDVWAFFNNDAAQIAPAPIAARMLRELVERGQ